MKTTTRKPALATTGERLHGLPVCRIGTPAGDAAKELWQQSLHSLMRAEVRGEAITQDMLDEAWRAKAAYFEATGRPAPERYVAERAEGVRPLPATVDLIAGPDATAPADDGLERELPDYEPAGEDARRWAEEVGHLKTQRPKVGPFSLPEHDAAIAAARRKTTLAALKAHRNALVREILGLTVATVDENLNGWSGDRLAEIGAVDADLMVADEAHKPFVGWACYRARLLRGGKPVSFRPAGRRF